MNIDGKCHCGYLSYKAEVDPASVEICHCSDCQTLSGSAFRIVVPAMAGSFQFVSGTPKTYVKTSASGNRREQGFCPECGTPVYSGPGDGSSGFLGLRVGAFRQRDQLVPQEQYWMRSAQGWTQYMGDLRSHDTE